jgi:CSLREA domain-containing protein
LGAAPLTVHATDATIIVDSNADNDIVDSTCTLREAIQASLIDSDYHGCTSLSGTYGDDRITFSLSGSTTITLGSDLPDIGGGEKLTIDGSNGGTPVTIDGANTYQHFSITAGAATLTLANLTIAHGSAVTGGAVANWGNLVVINTTFIGNKADSDGGAINTTAGSHATIANSTFSGNSAAFGAALENNSGTVAILNSTFSGNVTTGSFDDATVSSWDGGAGLPVTTIYNTIIANSTATYDCWNFDGATLSGNHNIMETTAGGNNSCAAITMTTADPKLGALVGAPSFPDFFPLLAGSPAIDKGRAKTCSSAPLYNASQNGVQRPQDGNKDTKAVCDIGSYEAPGYTFRSAGMKDGWVLESSEISNQGGMINSNAGTLRVGDEASNAQYRSVLSFNTAAVPDGAIISNVRLKLRPQSTVGSGDPLALLQGFKVDVKKGFFGSLVDLQKGDFQAGATHSYGPFTPTLSNGWYMITLTPAKVDINKLATNAGVTQIRLRFNIDDNNDALANYLNLYSGNASTAGYRPILFVDWSNP